MSTLLALTAFTALISTVTLDQSGLLFSSCALLISLTVFWLASAYHHLRQNIVQLGQLVRIDEIGKGAFCAFDTRAKAEDVLDAIRYRLHTLSWRIDSITSRKAEVNAKELITRSGVVNKETGLLDFARLYDEMTTMLYEGFPCIGAAVVGRRDQKDSGLQECFVHSAGIRGRKFERLLRVLESEIRFVEREPKMLMSHADGRGGLSSNLAVFGVGSSLCLNLKFPCGDDMHRAFLWVGFCVERVPSSQEQGWLQEFLQAVDYEVYNIQQLFELKLNLHDTRKSSAEKDQIFSHFSHDIRSPLNNIRSILHLLALEGITSENASFLKIALGNCESLEEIVDSILEYSRHAEGELSSSPVYVSLTGLIESVVNNFSALAKAKGISLEFEIDDNTDSSDVIFADQKHVKRILLNLVSNAIKYTRFGWIRVRLSLIQADSISIGVVDTGCGMTEEQLRELFVPFKRFGGSVEPGIGLGLALARVLAELNQGGIQVSSEPGLGSEFQLSFPRVRDVPVGAVIATELPAILAVSQNPQLEQMDDEYVRKKRDRISVLIVDDDQDLVSSLSRALTARGFETQEAVTVDDAIGICNFDCPEVLLTDDQMPHGGGERLLRFLRSLHTRPRVIALTGSSDQEKRRTLLAAGAIEVFTKPIDLDELCEWIDSNAHFQEKEVSSTSQLVA